MDSIRRSVNAFYSINFFKACDFSLPIRYFFLVNFLGFEIHQAIIIITSYSFASLIFEVPSGAWADRFGRKRMYIIGNILCIFGFTFFLWSESFLILLLAFFMVGAGSSLMSGNLEALMHDEFHEKKLPDTDYEDVLSKQYFYYFIGRASSSLLAGFLYLYNEYLPFIATIACYSLIFILLTFMPNPKQFFSSENTNFGHIKIALSEIAKNKELIFVMLFLGVVFNAIGNSYWYTYQPYLEKIGYNIEYIGIIFFFISIISASGALIARKLKKYFSVFQITNFMFALTILISILFVTFDKYAGILAIALLSLIFGFVMTLGNPFISKHSPKTHKSTMLSIFELGMSLFSAIAGVIAGIGVKAIGFEITYAILIGISVLIALWSFIYSRNIEKEGILEKA